MGINVRFFECGSVFEDIFSERVPEIPVTKRDAYLAAVMPSYKGEITGHYSLCLVPQSNRLSLPFPVVTYGMERDADITLSSVGDDACMRCLTRRLGNMDMQEICVRRLGLAPDALLAICSAQLIAKIANNPEGSLVYFQ